MNPFERYGWNKEARFTNRPWWRMTADNCSVVYRRDDRESFRGPLMDHQKVAADYDLEHPLPPPEPLVGQVWHRSNGDGTWRDQIIVDVAFTRLGLMYWFAKDIEPSSEWPPFNGILVSGCGAPWAPADWKCEE